MHRTATLALALAATGFLAMNAPNTPQDERRFETTLKKDVRYGYLVSLPANYDAAPSETFPVIVFLHGSGETGADLAKLKTQGLAKLLEHRGDLPALAPFIVLSPQTPTRPWDPEALDAWLDAALQGVRADTHRIYLTGLSMGGFATWDWAGRHPERFAAIAPICGGGNMWSTRQLGKTPIWAFHGGADSVVPVEWGQAMADGARKAGADVKWTVYPGVDHDSWTRTYANPELYAWFLKHRR
jgi:predicted peptidase